MNELKIITYQNQRILNTQQLAESYDTSVKRISQNFNTNKERYQEGKHYFLSLIHIYVILLPLSIWKWMLN